MPRFFHIEQGKRYYCELLNHDDGIAGTFSVSGGDIRLSLIRFDEFFHLEERQTYRVRTEDNWVASMFDTLPAGSGQRGGRHNCAYYEEIIANTTVIGFDAWADCDRVRRVQFRIPGADPLFEHSPIFEKAVDSKLGTTKTDLFTADTGNEKITGWLLLSGGMRSRTPERAEPWITIEFADGSTLYEMRNAVTRRHRRELRYLLVCGSRARMYEFVACTQRSTDWNRSNGEGWSSQSCSRVSPVFWPKSISSAPLCLRLRTI